ncbi:Uncharacterised protein [Escherichia coli]|uniref:Uncharacterized protein n=1 Tax=Escherichia coli TaxID=562 RepID=A0A377B813_ECOLX|nr:Uncharacterised protein [Escherichia coli]
MVTADKRFDFADVEGFLENAAKDANQQPHHANVVQQTNERSDEDNRREYAKGEDKTPHRQRGHSIFGPTSEPKMKALPASL